MSVTLPNIMAKTISIFLFRKTISGPMTTWVEKLSLYIFWECYNLCHNYEVSLKEEYTDLRKTSLDSYLYPKSVITLYIFDSRVLYKAVKNADPDFIKFKIVEGDVEDVA